MDEDHRLRLRPFTETDLGFLDRIDCLRYTTAHRLEAWTEAGNVAEQRVLERLEFQREGVLREVGWRDGAWRDAVVYALPRT